MSRQSAAVFAVFTLFTMICAGPVSGQDTQEVPDSNLNDNRPDASETARMLPSQERYRIGFEDVLQVTVYRHPELSQTLSVAQDGTIVLPRIERPIVAVCKTERELSDLITELYKNYLRSPYVNVRAVEQRSQPFAVLGAVNKPGSFFLGRRVRLIELLAFAGGPDVERAGQRIRITRLGNRTACSEEDAKVADVEFFSYTVNDVLEGKENPWMEPGDIVSLLEAEEAYVVGAVIEPAKIALKEPITLTQAIAKAGGITSKAKTGKVKIQRQQSGTTAKEELVFDLSEIAARKVEDPLIMGNDIVVVPTDNTKVLTQGLFKVLTGGLGNMFYRVPL